MTGRDVHVPYRIDALRTCAHLRKGQAIARKSELPFRDFLREAMKMLKGSFAERDATLAGAVLARQQTRSGAERRPRLYGSFVEDTFQVLPSVLPISKVAREVN
jgi:hypothetical protein